MSKVEIHEKKFKNDSSRFRHWLKSDKFKCYKLWEEVDWQFSREILFWGAWYLFNLAI